MVFLLARFSSSVHVWNDDSQKGAREEQRWTYVPAGSLSDDFHTYAATVTPKTIDIYFDGRRVQSFPTPRQLNRPMGILVDLSLGAGWPISQTLNPSVMQVSLRQSLRTLIGRRRGEAPVSRRQQRAVVHQHARPWRRITDACRAAPIVTLLSATD